MSPSRRRKTSERTSKTGRRELADDLSALDPAPGEELPLLESADEDLPVLEPDDELEELEPESPSPDSPIKVRCAPTDVPRFDTAVHIDVPEMDKAAVAEAVAGPLQRAVEQAAASLRYRRVLVCFEGKALISSAVKDLVAKTMAATKPAKVVVRRGYGDELVHEGVVPKVALTTRAEGDTVHVDVDSGALQAGDLGPALAPEMTKLAAGATGKTFEFTFKGAAPDAHARDSLRTALHGAGAARARVGPDLLFDRELEARVRLGSSQGSASIQITPSDDEDTTLAALDMVLGPKTEQLTGRKVFVEFLGRAARPREVARLVELCQTAKPARVQIAAEKGEPDQIWPLLLGVASGEDGVVLHVRDGGRGKPALIAAFVREVAAMPGALAGKRVTVDWPAGFTLDPAVEQACLVEALAAHGVATVACTFGGEHREPFAPPPVSFTHAPGGGWVARVATDTGTPPELARALERRFSQRAADLRGQALRVEIQGAGATSRGMLRSLTDASRTAGVSRLEVDDHGVVDVLVPPLLAVTKTAGGKGRPGGVRLVADPLGRSPKQIEQALERELEAAEVGDNTVWTIAASPLAADLIAAATARGASRVVLEGDPPVQVHPPLLAVERADDRLTLRATPGADDRAAAAQIARELPGVLAEQGGLGAVTVTVVWPDAKDAAAGAVGELIRRLVAANPSKVLLESGRGRRKQVHPEVVPDYVALIGRKNDEAAPLAMFAVDLGTGDQHLARVQGKFEGFATLLDGRRVLLVFRADGSDRAADDKHALVGAVRAFVDPRAGATLVYRGVDAQRRGYFEVVHSKIEAVKVGARFADPRPSRPS